MLKAITLFRIDENWTAPTDDVLNDALDYEMFQPCGRSQAMSTGWVSPRNEDPTALSERVNGQIILKLMVEKKTVPASLVKRIFEERVAKIEAETGRVPGRKIKKELKEEIFFELLPNAFPKQTSCYVWVDPKAKLLVVGSTSKSVTDQVARVFVATMERANCAAAISLLQTNASVCGSMSAWLQDREAPARFTLDRECELADAEKAVVKYTKHNLDMDEISNHILSGKQATKLAMTFDSKISFVLSANLQIKKLEYLGVPMSKEKADNFDSDMAIATGGLSELIPALIEALDGELVLNKKS